MFHGTEGVGKTSFAAYAPRPLFLMARGETGIETLVDNGQLPATAMLPELMTWADVIGSVEAVIAGKHDYRTLVLDALGGFERLCHEFVCQREFNGDWSDRGFQGYMRGYDVALADWRQFLGLLDRVRAERRMSILILAHTRVKQFKNPEGSDFDRYSVDAHEKTWSLTHKWADMVLFANFATEAQKDGAGRVKGKGGTRRVLYTQRTAAWDAKNRNGLPYQIDLGNSGSQAWANFSAALKNAQPPAGAADDKTNEANEANEPTAAKDEVMT